MAMSALRDQWGRPPKPSVQAKAIAASATTAMMSRVNECATPSIPDRTAASAPGSRTEALAWGDSNGRGRIEPPQQCNAECWHSLPLPQNERRAPRDPPFHAVVACLVAGVAVH